jgi:hypothetical protein
VFEVIEEIGILGEERLGLCWETSIILFPCLTGALPDCLAWTITAVVDSIPVPVQAVEAVVVLKHMPFHYSVKETLEYSVLNPVARQGQQEDMVGPKEYYFPPVDSN